MIGIDYNVLRKLVLEFLKKEPNTQCGNIVSGVERLAAQYNAFPTEEECKQRKIDYSYYKGKRLNPIDALNIKQIIWDIIVDRILTVGSDISNQDLPFVRLTEFGSVVVNQEIPSFYDPEGYGLTLDSIVPKVDPVIKQYVIEGLNCFRQRLFFASAVMFGAAAEKTILLLLESIYNADTNQKKKKDIGQLLEYPNLPKIFSIVQSTIEALIRKKIIPYSVHQGSTEHLLSLFETIRVQRNDAVHPVSGQVNQTKIFLTIQTLPTAVDTVYRLIGWFNNNKI